MAGSQRLVAYVNCPCGFGASRFRHDAWSFDTCENSAANTVLEWELKGVSPITHYVLSFVSFNTTTGNLRPDPGPIWGNAGINGSFALNRGIAAAMSQAQSRGKKVMLSIGGETGSAQFLAWWASRGMSASARITAMKKALETAITEFESANSQWQLIVDGIDIDIELGGGYAVGSDKWISTSELITAVPDHILTAFVPQVGNGLCAAPVVSDFENKSQTSVLGPLESLGGQCMSPGSAGAPWSLALMDASLKKANGSPKLDWLGIQYYNAASALCCGGGTSAAEQVQSAAQNYKNLALGWPAVTEAEMAVETSAWHQWQWWPGPWAAFDGIGADRLVLGKPGCAGCAGSNYLDEAGITSLLREVGLGLGTQGVANKFGGVLFWDLCRLFGTTGKFCVDSFCQPAWGSEDSALDALQRLTTNMAEMSNFTRL